MADTMEWWRRMKRGLLDGGFHEDEEASVSSAQCGQGEHVVCVEAGCGGSPEYHGFVRGDSYLGFIVCPRCGGVWNPRTLEKFN